MIKDVARNQDTARSLGIYFEPNAVFGRPSGVIGCRRMLGFGPWCGRCYRRLHGYSFEKERRHCETAIVCERTLPPLSVVTHLVGIMRQPLSNPLDCSSSNGYTSPVPRSDKFWISLLIPNRVLSPDNSFKVVSSTEDSGSQIRIWKFPKGTTTLVAFVANLMEKRGKSLTGSSESVALNAKSATSCNSAEILGLDRSTSSAISFSSSCRGCSDS